MINLIRKKRGFSILEKRYPESLENNKKYSKVIVYSFENLKTKWNKEKTCVMFIDLTKELNDIWKGFKKNYRHHIRKEKKQGIIIMRGVDKDYDKFYEELYLPLCKRKKLKPYSLKYMKQGNLFYSKLDNKMLAGQIIFNDNIYATQSFNAADTSIEYNGNRSITWYIIKYYKENGAVHFNFGGGESSYKKRFGCEKKDVWIYHIYNNKIIKIVKECIETIKQYRCLADYLIIQKEKEILGKNAQQIKRK